MVPRRYEMGARAESVAQTRGRIVRAAMDLHTERGLFATSWDDIAELARVSPATVYRHFPSPTELIPACARTVFDLIQPPTLADARSQFAAIGSASDRLQHVARESAHFYGMGRRWLHAAYRERDFIPELDEALRVIEDTLDVLVRAAAGKRLPKRVHALLFVHCNFPFWHSLVDSGLSDAAASDTMTRLVRGEAARAGLD